MAVKFNKIDKKIIDEFLKPNIKFYKNKQLRLIIVTVLAFISLVYCIIEITLDDIQSDLIYVVALICFWVIMMMFFYLKGCRRFLKLNVEYLKRIQDGYKVIVEDDVTITIVEKENEDIRITKVKELTLDENNKEIIVGGDIIQGGKDINTCKIPYAFVDNNKLINFLRLNYAQESIKNLSNNTLSKILSLPDNIRNDMLSQELNDSRFIICVSLNENDGVSVYTKENVEYYAYYQDNYIQLFGSVKDIPTYVFKQYPVLLTTTLNDIAHLDYMVTSDVFKDEARIQGVRINVGGNIITLSNKDIDIIVGK